MKVYFTHSRVTPNEQVEIFINYLKKKDITILMRDFPSNPSEMDFKEAEALYVSNLKKIKSADIIITEISFISSDIGYEISLALQEKKPVIAFYNMSEQKDNPRHIKNVPMGLKGNKSKYLIVKEYDPKSLDKTLEVALNDAKALADTKFILIIPPRIDRYLEWNVRERGKSKAEITRESIEKVMDSDDRYQEYLKNSGLEE